MGNSNCLLCNSENIKIYIHHPALREKRDILKCRHCGLVFFEDGIDKKLDDHYWDSKEQAKLYEQEKIQEGFEEEFKRRMQTIEHFHRKGSLLDIGCGLGSFLKVARASGWKVSGVEISESAAKYARKKYSLKIQTGTIESSNFGHDSFDVITMWDVIEHIQNPLEALTAVKNKLKSKGLLVVKTPDEKSLFKKIARLIYVVSRRKINFLLKYVYYSPHYFYYDKRTISKLLEKFGFKIIKIEKETTDYNFAKEKIKHHYRKFVSRNIILFGLPIAFFFSRFFNLQNKMVVYAVKAK